MLGSNRRLYSTINVPTEEKSLSSTPSFGGALKKKRLTKLEQAEFNVPMNLRDVLVGLLLGYLCAQKCSVNVNTNLHFEQGFVNK